MYKILLLIVVAVFLSVSGCNQSEDPIERLILQALKRKKDTSIPATSNELEHPNQPPKFCPKPEELIKNDKQWTTPDNNWKNFTPSASSKVINFIGAQWVGVKIGKVICLYQTDEAVSFPLALERLGAESAFEPVGSGWSALINNRKFCKSANIADCVYFTEQPKDIDNIYKEIEYNPSERKQDSL